MWYMMPILNCYMKFFVLLELLLLPSALCGKNGLPEIRSYSVFHSLKGNVSWNMKGATLTFVQEGESCYLRNGEKVLYSWLTPLEVSGAVCSEKGTVLLVLVFNSGGQYHGITRITLNDGKWTTDEVVLKTHQNIKMQNLLFVRELGAVANDGKTALLNVGEPPRDPKFLPSGYPVLFSWQTWNLDENKQIAKGLIGNVRKGNKVQK